MAKTLARQVGHHFRAAVTPANSGLANRSGTDALVHMVRAAVEGDAQCTLVSIDGVGAYDHIARAKMLGALWRNPALRDLLPFVRLWLARQSVYVWRDENGETHDIEHGEGGEQGDALMPALFCLAMQPALDAIQARLEPSDRVVAYLHPHPSRPLSCCL